MLKCVALASLLCTLPMAASAVLQTVSYSNGIDPAIVVCDGDLEDLDPAPKQIRVDFSLTDALGDWTADGVIFATTGNPAGATLVVTQTQIVNVTGNQIIAAVLEVKHDFPPLVSFTQQYVANIDGAFDKLGGGILGNFILEYTATLMGGVPVGNFFFMDGLALAPIPFDYTGLPVHEDTVTQQVQRITFYMDEIDNVIELFDSATILPVLPVPSLDRTGVLGLLLLLGACALLALHRQRAALAGR